MKQEGLDLSSGACHACGATNKPLMKLSLGKDFFGRPYDRLSPSADQSPRWYCEVCSLHKNLQRDFRDIRSEFEKLGSGQPSELARAEELQRAQTRLREIAALLDGRESGSPLINVGEVTSLLHRLQNQPSALTT
ncbi:MAG TPA: hypothetical protein VNK46_00635 [Nitrospiraceae bacterium]|nr:hypothetical protein [Nitrospiraceae bacterium]